MKKLFVLRHAKSSWDDSNLADFDRPLNGRGLNAAPFMGELIARKSLMPDLFLSSPAKRASQTAALVKESSGSNAELRFDERIYEASPNTLCQVITEIDDANDSAMIVGHNPGMEGLIRLLTGSSEPMPTAALASIDLNVKSWGEVSAGSGRLVQLIRPKEEMKNLGTSSP